MSNNYVPNESDLLPGELARSADINLRYSNLVAGFDLLPTPLGSGQTGFSAALNVGTPTADAHAVTKLYATTTIVTAAEAAALAYIQPTLAAHLAATTVLRNEAAASATASANSAAASQTSRLAAETAETNAETAETNAETAEAASVVAKNASQASASASAASAVTAAAGAADVLANKNAAAVSATNSAASAVTSNTAKTAALAAQAAAETAETNAEAAESNVAASASAASASAASALTSKNSATASATSATSSASSASGSSGTATTKANESAASATAALASKNSATTSATTATNQAATATTKAGEASTSASAAATSSSTATTQAGIATTKAGESSSSATAAASSASAAAASFDQFDDIYLGAKASAPSVDNDGNALGTGALYFNTVSNTMFVYSGSSWAAAGSAVNGTAERQEYTATSGQTTFNATYDVGFVDVYLNGSRLVPTTDFTASNGATVVLTTGATTGDNVGIIAYAAFSLASVYTKSQSDSRYFQIANNLSDLASAPTALTNLGLTATATELNYTDGVTSSIQTQLDNLDSLPSQTGNSGKLLTTNGTVAAWQASTGTGNVVLSTTPTLTTPILSGITTTASGSMEFAPANYTMVVRGGGSDEGSITLNCAANTHGQTITSQPHSANATNTMLLPEGANSTLLSRVSTDTLTNKTISGSANTITNVALATGVTGTLPVANGGTGVTAAGTTGNVLTSDGTNWTSVSAPSSSPSYSAVASGAIANGAKVIVNSAGTVSSVLETQGSPVLSAEATATSTDASGSACAYHKVEKQTAVFYRNPSNSNYLMGVVGTANSSATGGVAWGTPQIVGTTGVYGVLQATYCDSQGCIALLFLDNSGHMAITAFNINSGVLAGGTSVAAGTQVQPCMTYDTTQGQLIVGYWTAYPYYGYVRTVTLSGTTVTWNTALLISQQYSASPAVSYDPVRNMGLFMLYNGQNGQSWCYSFTISGTTLTYTGYGKSSPMGAAFQKPPAFIYDPVSGNHIAFASMSGGTGKAVALYLNSNNSGEVLSGSVYQWTSASVNWVRAAYVTAAGKFVIAYSDSSNSDLYTIIASASGTVVSFTGLIQTSASLDQYNELDVCAWDSLKTALVTYDETSAGQFSRTYSPISFSTTLTASNYIGISDGAYANGDTATVQLVGSVDDAQTSLTAGQAYYVQGNGTLANSADTIAVFAGTAVSATKLIVKG